MDLAKVSIITIGLISVIILLLIYKQAGTWHTLQQQLDTEQTALSQAEVQLQSLKQLASQAANLQAQLQQLENTLPTEPKEDFLVKELQRQAYNSGMKLMQIKFNQYQTKKDYTEIPFNFALEGKFSGLEYFLQELQQGPRTVVIRELKVSREDEGAPVVRVDLVASAFYVPT